MTVAAILLAVIVGGGLILYLLDRMKQRNTDDESDKLDVSDSPDISVESDTECCGMHITCEKDSLVAGIDRELLYYDDEELDAFRGREADSYTPEEIEIFREILLTLRPEEIAGWARSITTRGITLPPDVRDELLIIVADARYSKSLSQDKTAKKEATNGIA